jgi:hypothetical protein
MEAVLKIKDRLVAKPSPDPPMPLNISTTTSS